MDLSQLAASIVDDATAEDDGRVEEEPEKNPHAVALGRLGGLKGGKARAKKLSAKRRREIARDAARVRWRKHGEESP